MPCSDLQRDALDRRVLRGLFLEPPDLRIGRGLHVAQEPPPVPAEPLPSLLRAQPGQPPARFGRPPGPRLRRQLVERPRPELPDRSRRQAEQLLRRPPHAVLLGDRHAEPALQGRVDLAAVERADVVAVGALRRRALQGAAAVDDRQVVGGVVPAEDLLKPRPDRVALPVPGELVGVDQPPGGHGPDDQPLGEPVPRPQPQAPGRLPGGDAEAVEIPGGVGGDGVIGLGPAEVERDDRLDPRVEGGRHGRRVAAAGDRAQEDDAVLVDAGAGQQQVQAAHQVPDHPAHQALADEVQLHAGVVAEIVVLPADPEGVRIVGLGAERVLPPLAVAEVVHDQHQATAAGPRSCPCPAARPGSWGCGGCGRSGCRASTVGGLAG